MTPATRKRLEKLEAQHNAPDAVADAKLLARAITWLADAPSDRPPMPDDLQAPVAHLLRECPGLADGF
jgi:hypothetical protein